MKKFLIAPSILSANFAALGKDIKKVLKAGGNIIHFDVMDNHYVPNLTVGPLVLESLRNDGITAPIDVHLMTYHVDNLIAKFAKAGANNITFHPESSNNIEKSIKLIKDYKCKAGLALNINTSLNYLNSNVINQIDILLLMAVKPGFSGQKLSSKIFKKIIKVRKVLKKSNNKILLGIDGGVKLENIYKLALFGIDLFVIGSAIFNNNDYKLIIDNMNKELLKVNK